MTAVLFTAAAATGALVRWQAGRLLPRPFSTLAVNVAGAFALGLLSGATDPVMTVAGVGGIGALTTFSTLADDIRHLAVGDPAKAAAYLAATLTVGLAAAAAGLAAAP